MILFGTNRMNGAFVGVSAVSKIYVGTDLVYQKSSGGSSVLFDGGWIEGIEWSGNLLTRPNYTQLGLYSFNYVETDGYMLIIAGESGGSSSLNYNAHVCTTNMITIPSNVTKLKVRIERSANSAYLKFGLLPATYKDAMDDSLGGKLSSLITASSGTNDYELALNSGMAGSSLYRVVVNIRGVGNRYQHFRISKVWFE